MSGGQQQGFTHEKTDTSRLHRDEWFTPRWLIDGIGDPIFDMDVAAPDASERALMSVRANRYLTQQHDGLLVEWNGFVWCNPPYSFIDAWSEKFTRYDGPGLWISYNRTETEWCQRLMSWCGWALFLNRRVNFVDARPQVFDKASGLYVTNERYGSDDNAPGSGSVIFSRGSGRDYQALLLAARSNQLGKLVKMN